jgi:DNA-binding MarR family transcriptional regulator
VPDAGPGTVGHGKDDVATGQEGPSEAERLRRPGIAYLLSVLGTASTQRWQRRMRDLGLDPREVVVLRMVAADPGRSQRSLAPALQVRATHLVAVIDTMQGKGLLERRTNPADRRAHALYLTRRGEETLERAMRVSRSHEDDLTVGLDAAERRALEGLLTRMAGALEVAHGGHPGFDDPD